MSYVRYNAYLYALLRTCTHLQIFLEFKFLKGFPSRESSFKLIIILVTSQQQSQSANADYHHGHRCKMGNLFNSVKLAQLAYCLPNPVLDNGVLRKSGRCCPPCVMQEEKTGRAADAARGTVKAAVLKGDSRLSNLVVASCYN